MYVVVQTIQRKKPNKGGEYREYEVSSMSIQLPDGIVKTHYSYYPRYEAGRFDRPHLEAYKISIHESRRESGKVVKKQCVAGTIGYYALAEWGLFDYIDRGINHAVDVFGVDYETLYRNRRCNHHGNQPLDAAQHRRAQGQSHVYPRRRKPTDGLKTALWKRLTLELKNSAVTLKLDLHPRTAFRSDIAAR